MDQKLCYLFINGLFLPDSLDIVGQTIFYNCKFYKNNTKFAFYKMASKIKFMLKCLVGLDTCVFVYIVIAMSD